MTSKTYAELAVATDLQSGDLLASFRGIGPLKSITAAVAKAYFIDGVMLADGSVAMTGTLKGYVGSESLPCYTFDGDTDSGLYRVGANEIGLSTGGVRRALFNSSGITATTFIGNLTGNVTGNVTGNIAGNADTATKWATARNLSLTGDGTATLASVDGSAAVSAALTLATVNSNVGSFGSGTQVTSLTVNAKGLVTAASNTTISITDSNLSAAVGVAKGGTGATTASGARTNLGLGTIATQDASAVTITGGSITGITDLAVADGGTGASSFTSGAVLLGNGTSAVSAVTGTNGQLLTHNGTAWAAASPTSAWTQIGSTTTVSSPVSSVVFSSIPTTYSDIMLTVDGASHNNGSATDMNFSISSNNGSAWSNSSLLVNGVAAAAVLMAAVRVGNYQSTICLIDAAGAVKGAAPDVEMTTNPDTAVAVMSAAVNAIRITFTAGSIDAGTFKLWGR